MDRALVGQDQGPRRQIAKALRLLIDCQRLYKSTDAHGKRLANQTFTNGIDIDEDAEATLRLAEPFAVTTGKTLMSGVRLRLKSWSLGDSNS